MNPNELLLLADQDPTAARSLHLRDQAAAAAAIVAPPPELVDQLGPRPAGGPERRAWERAIGLTAIYRDRWGLEPPQSTDAEDQRTAWARTQIATHDAVVVIAAAQS